MRRGAVREEEAAPIADLAPLAGNMMIDAERAARAHTCLDTLEETPRDAIRTAFFECTTYAALAESQGVQLGTMKSRLRRGLAKLRGPMEAGE